MLSYTWSTGGRVSMQEMQSSPFDSQSLWKTSFKMVLFNHYHVSSNPHQQPTVLWLLWGSWRRESVEGQVLPPQTVVFLLLLRLHPLRREATKDKRLFGPFDLLSTTFTVLGGVLTLRSGGFPTWKVPLSERLFSASSQNKSWQLMLNWQQAAAEPPAKGLDLQRITRPV